jgi:phenylpropionate dioxygenase-like ring-hydroxylating dioxygenase large terminal subunit
MLTPQLPLTRYIHPVMPAKELKKKPKAVQIGEEKIVLFRNAKGEAVAVEDRCPHRFTPLSTGTVTKNGEIACPYHGWKVDGAGKVEAPHQGEMKGCKLKTYNVLEKHNYLWISERSAEQVIFPLEMSEDWIPLTSYYIDFEAPFHVTFDNFSEDEHFPYVHKIFGWDEQLAKDVKFDYSVGEDQIDVHYLGPQRKFPLMRFFMMKPSQYFRNDWEVKFDPPRITYTVQMTDSAGHLDSPAMSRVRIFFVPIGANRTRLHMFQYAKYINPKYNFLLQLFKPTLVGWAKKDIMNDFHFTKKIAHVPYEFHGMRLGKYDAPLVHGRRLLKKIYFGADTLTEATHKRGASANVDNYPSI